MDGLSRNSNFMASSREMIRLSLPLVMRRKWSCSTDTLKAARTSRLHSMVEAGSAMVSPTENHNRARQAGSASLLSKRLLGIPARGRAAPTHDCSVVARPRSDAVRVEALPRHLAHAEKGQTAHIGNGQERMIARWLLAGKHNNLA
jgi:hypothetical protein